MRSAIAIDEKMLKNAVKAAIVELINERQEAVQELFEEAMLDVGLARAIREGNRSPIVSRQAIDRLLGANR